MTVNTLADELDALASASASAAGLCSALIGEAEKAGDLLNECAAQADALAIEKPVREEEAVRRVMERDNLARTPAAKIPETDAEFAGFLTRVANVADKKRRAERDLDILKLRAKLALAITFAQVGAP